MESIFKQIDDCEYFYADLRNGNLFQIVSEIGYAYSKGKPIFLNLETLNVDNAFLYALSYKSLNSIVNNRKNKLRFFEHDHLLPEGMRDLMFYYGQLKTLLLN
jgi:nucleoside 2-deoxyribosyltransferase